MHDLAGRTATATGRADIAQMLEQHLREALEPRFLVVYLLRADGRLAAIGGPVPAELATLPGDLALLADLARRARCWVASPGAAADEVVNSPLGALEVHCLVPVTDRQQRPVGLFVLGPRRSGEAY